MSLFKFVVPKIIQDLLSKAGLVKQRASGSVNEEAVDAADSDLCCNGSVVVFYRGISDDRLYKADDRHWKEVKYFRPVGLRVFCKVLSPKFVVIGLVWTRF